MRGSIQSLENRWVYREYQRMLIEREGREPIPLCTTSSGECRVMGLGHYYILVAIKQRGKVVSFIDSLDECLYDLRELNGLEGIGDVELRNFEKLCSRDLVNCRTRYKYRIWTEA